MMQAQNPMVTHGQDERPILPWFSLDVSINFHGIGDHEQEHIMNRSPVEVPRRSRTGTTIQVWEVIIQDGEAWRKSHALIAGWFSVFMESHTPKNRGFGVASSLRKPWDMSVSVSWVTSPSLTCVLQEISGLTGDPQVSGPGTNFAHETIKSEHFFLTSKWVWNTWTLLEHHKTAPCGQFTPGVPVTLQDTCRPSNWLLVVLSIQEARGPRGVGEETTPWAAVVLNLPPSIFAQSSSNQATLTVPKRGFGGRLQSHTPSSDAWSLLWHGSKEAATNM